MTGIFPSSALRAPSPAGEGFAGQDIFIEPGGDWLKVNENVGFAFGRSNPADESQEEIPTPLVPLPGGGGKAEEDIRGREWEPSPTVKEDLAQTIHSWGLPIGVEDPSSPFWFPQLESYYQAGFCACRVKREMDGKSLLISVKGPGGEDLLKHLKDWIENLPKEIVMQEALEFPESWWKPVGNERLDGVVGIMCIIPSTERNL